ncbi:Uncharacterized protein dnl_48690 [Desulfonema limicola]|uniref:Uncharacterized protein n=1 Tax=Desulfonema limicola TaxID=45656 RepID=A0A975BBU5_9BACT|nr:hypothetical protein [Desulfonema limicola]QTA82493.1 Uncharacterized protein dnl_48690 [Desulfonema limicola]
MKLEKIIKFFVVIFFILPMTVFADDVYENFERDSGGFGKNDYFTVSNGLYFFNGNGSELSNFVFWNGGDNPSKDGSFQFGNSSYFYNFVISTDVYWEKGDDNGAYGLLIEIQINNSTYDLIGFYINQKGCYGVKRFKEGKKEIIIPETESNHIIFGRYFNHLSIAKSGDGFQFSINNAEVAKIAMPNCTGGGVGILANHQVNVGFDNFTVAEVYPSKRDRVSIKGSVIDENTNPLCVMVLANGQYMFSCDNLGKYELDVPVDDFNEVTVFSFCDGLAPYKQILELYDDVNFDIKMITASPNSKTMSLTSVMNNLNNGKVQIKGTVTDENGSPLCAMVLANGQYMFSCHGYGNYELEVPLDERGEITLFGFCDGIQPYKTILKP